MKKLKTILGILIASFLSTSCIQTENVKDFIQQDNSSQIIFISPTPNTEKITGKTPIVFLWDKPIFIMQSPERWQKFLKRNIKIKPKIEGTWQILGSTGILFDPKEEWKESTKYEVEISKKIIKSPKYIFETARLEIEEVDSQNTYGKNPIIIKANQPMLLSEMEKIKISPKMPFLIKAGKAENGNIDTKQINLIPTKNWPEGQEYKLTIPKGTKAKNGTLKTTKDQEITFTTIPPLNVNIEIPKNVFNGIYLNFSQEVPIKKIWDSLEIENKTTPLSKEYWEKIKSNWEDDPEAMVSGLYLPPEKNAWNAMQEYTIKVKKGLRDKWDRELKETQETTFSTVFPDDIKSIFFPSTTNIFQTGTVPKFAILYSGKIKNPKITFTKESSEKKSKTHQWEWQESRNQQKVQEIKIPELFPEFLNEQKKLAPGVYNMEINWNEGENNWDYSRETNFIITDFPVEIKNQANKKTQVSISSFDQTQNTTNNEKGEIIMYKKTGEPKKWTTNFPAEIETTNEYFILEIKHQNQKGYYINGFYSQNISMYDTPINYSPWEYSRDLQGVLFSDRPLFKPGDTMFFKSIFRDKQKWEKAFSLKTGSETGTKKYEIKIFDPIYTEVFSKKENSDIGSLNFQWQIPSSAKLGQYQAKIIFEKNGTIEEYSEDNLVTNFYVSEYKKPNFLIDAKWDQAFAIQQEKNTLQGTAHYAFGSPLSGKKAKYNISLFGHKKSFWYFEESYGKDLLLLSGETIIQNDGSFKIEIQPSKKLDPDIDWKTLTADLTIELSTEERSSLNLSLPFFSAEDEITIQQENYFFDETTKEIPIQAKIINRKTKNPEKNKDAEIALFQKKWVRADRKDSNGIFQGEWRTTEELQTKKTKKTNEKGELITSIEKPKKSGQYFIRITTKDTKKRESKEEMHFWIWDQEPENHTIRSNATNKTIALFANKTKYQKGETAKILFPIKKEEFKINKIKASIERGKVLETKEINKESNTIEIPIEKWMAPNVIISVLIEGTDKDGDADIRWGAINIPVKDPSHTLEIKLTPDKTEYAPQEEINLDIETMSEGKPVSAEITIAVVDKTLLALMARPPLNLWQTFLSEFPLGVETIHTLSNFLSEKKLKEIYAQIEKIKEIASDMFGGGGGKGEDENAPRGEFKDTAYFKAKIITKEQGKANIKIPLPDNLTQWHIYAIGATNENAFGEAETLVQTKKDLLITPLLPNFFREGDKTTIGMLIKKTINTDIEEEITITIKPPKEIKTTKTQEIIKLKDEAQIYFESEVTNIEKQKMGIFEFEAISKSGKKDAIKIERKIMPSWGETYAGEFLKIKDATKITFKADEKAIKSHLQITITKTILDQIKKISDKASENNYACTEQQWAQSTTEMLYQKIIGNKENKKEQWEKTKNKILASMGEDGGIRFWPQSRYVQEGNIWLTANILEFAPLWKEFQMEFPAETKVNAQKWLKNKLLNDCKNTNNTCEDDATIQHAVFVLIRDKIIPAQDLEIWENRTNSLEAKIWFIKSIDVSGGTKTTSKKLQNKYKEIKKEIQERFQPNDRYTFWEEKETEKTFYSQPQRLTALIFEWTLQENILPSLQEKIAKYLLDTQNNISGNTSLRITSALEKYAEKNNKKNEKISFEIKINSKTETGNLSEKETLKIWEKEFTKNELSTIELKSLNQNNFFANILWKEKKKAEDITNYQKGFWIEREILDLETNEKQKNELKAGKTYKVRLKIVTNTHHKQVIIEDTILSGAEAINFDFQNNNREEKNKLKNAKTSAGWQRPWIENKETYFDKIRFFIPEMNAGAQEVEYLIRTQQLGEYTLLPPKIWEMYYPEKSAQGDGTKIKITK